MSMFYSIREALAGFRRARLSFSISVFTIAFLLFMNAVFALMAFNVNRLIDVLNARVDIQVFISGVLDDTQIALLGSNINALEDVADVEFISRDAAAMDFQQEFGEDLFSILDENPLPASFRITLHKDVRSIKRIEKLADEISAMEGVDEVEYHGEALGLLMRFSRIANLVTIALLLVVVIGSLFVVSNTIRLIVIARKDIINTMQLVGATRRFIVMPYIWEGLIQGLLGGVLAFAIVAGLFRVVEYQWPGILTVPQYGFYILIGAGIVFGYLGSIVAIKRYL